MPFGKILLLILFVLSVLQFFKVFTNTYYPDFSSYYYGPLAAFHGGNPYLGGKQFFTAFVYPPSVLLFFLPFTLLPFNAAERMFTVLSIVCLLFSFWLLFKLFNKTLYSITGVFLLTLLFNFFPEKFTLGMGQINNVILLLEVGFIYCYFKKLDYLAGVFLAFAIALKLSPVLLLLYVVIDRRWKMLFSTLLVLLGIGFVVGLFVSPNLNIHFLTAVLPGILGSWKGDYYNQSLSGFLLRDVHSIFLQQLLRTGLGILFLIFSLMLLWKYHKKNDATDLLSLSILITISLVINTFSWQHHFVWLLIPLIVTFFYLTLRHFHLIYYIVLGVSFVLVAVNLRTPSTVPVILQSHVLYGALLLYGLDAYLLFKESPKNLIL